MIIGKGMIATALQKINSSEVCFFGSGVSCSNIDNQREFDREKQLLEDTLESCPDFCTFIYFSSCGIAFENTPYFSHKLRMEIIVASRAKKYYIFRLPQVVGRDANKNTLFNYLISQIKKKKQLEVWENIKRNLIDIDDVVELINHFLSNNLKSNSTINIASPFNTSIIEIIENIETVLSIKVKYKLVQKGKSINIDITELSNVIDINVRFKNKDIYLQKLVKKYYEEII